MLSLRQLTQRYALFAIIATASNLAVQQAVIQLYAGTGQLEVSVFLGTLVGFAVKYMLDKNFIFFDRPASSADELLKVVLYGVTAVATTLIFWGFEFGFLMLWANPTAKFIGAVIGLSIGYVAKYQLDKRFVFAPRAAA